ncbi:enoyl-CoA hydratase/isomerase family protein [Solimonas marina]|uniref:Enoyl-CoA hydratase/isomerase family protein n=1 Tax=Solimonas marina TaxID=2714601 RepID=A0A969W5X7_9GAMM|nr:enoyl-CoA hydratase/isomerase family protein [Solimonas marina]NKF21027.1 enoyl-CoA hydratase/isomerase family protein [Solimonas marina]
MPSPAELLNYDTALVLARQHERTVYGPLAAPALLLTLDGAPASPDPIVVDWLRTLPAPVIGIGGAADASLALACDCHVDAAAAAAPLLATATRAPIAAMSFVQLLRLLPSLSLSDALVAESLAYATLQNGPEFRAWRDAHPPTPPAAGDHGPAVIAERDGERLMLTLNRPSNRNAMTVEMRDALCEALQLAVIDTDIAHIEIRGRGKCFSTGGDLREFGSAPDPATAHLVRSLALPGRVLATIATRSTVTVHGACIGSGIEFPAFAGRLIARADAWFQLPELKFGLIPGAGGCVSISRRIGRQRTAWLGLCGQPIGSEQALEWGLIDALAAQD